MQRDVSTAVARGALKRVGSGRGTMAREISHSAELHTRDS